jgi:phosphotransferase system HPr (HPr) family protein
MLSERLTITNELGLHARAAAQLVKRVSGFESRIFLKRPDLDKVVDAKSILAVLTLAAVKGTEVEVMTEGKDEFDAMSAITVLFANGFGEND